MAQSLTKREMEALALTIAGEIHPGLSKYGTERNRQEIAAILGVIENRTNLARQKAPTYSREDTVRAPKQFSTWNTAKERATAKKNFDKHKAHITRAIEDFYAGKLQSPVPDATHYYSPMGMQAIAGKNAPKWASALVGVNKVGPHVFGTMNSLQKQVASVRSQQPAAVPTRAVATSRVTAPAPVSAYSSFAPNKAASAPFSAVLGQQPAARQPDVFSTPTGLVQAASPVAPTRATPVQPTERISPVQTPQQRATAAYQQYAQSRMAAPPAPLSPVAAPATRAAPAPTPALMNPTPIARQVAPPAPAALPAPRTVAAPPPVAAVPPTFQPTPPAVAQAYQQNAQTRAAAPSQVGYGMAAMQSVMGGAAPQGYTARSVNDPSVSASPTSYGGYSVTNDKHGYTSYFSKDGSFMGTRYGPQDDTRQNTGLFGGTGKGLLSEVTGRNIAGALASQAGRMGGAALGTALGGPVGGIVGAIAGGALGGRAAKSANLGGLSGLLGGVLGNWHGNSFPARPEAPSQVGVADALASMRSYNESRGLEPSKAARDAVAAGKSGLY